MKKLLLPVLIMLMVIDAYPADKPATEEDALAFARSALPEEPILLAGTLQTTVKRRRKITRPIVIELNRGAECPTARYRVGKPGTKGYQSLAVIWRNGKPDYIFSDPDTKPTDCIPGTVISWADLSFSFLWNANAKQIGEETQNRNTYSIVQVSIPKSEYSMQLWIDRDTGILRETRTFNREQEEQSRMKIMSTKKRNDQYLMANLELRNLINEASTALMLSVVEWPVLNPSPVFDPVNANNELALDLYKALTEETQQNVLISPYSIASTLALPYCGAGGETAEQMANVLHLQNPLSTLAGFYHLQRILGNMEDSDQAKLSTANALWSRQDLTFLPDYLDLMNQYNCNSIIHPVDFSSDPEAVRLQINDWVEEQTHEQIKELIAPDTLGPDTRLIAINALYFEARWRNTFQRDGTRTAPFQLTDGTSINTKIMSQQDRFGYAEQDGYQVLELPYLGNDFSMLVLLPTKPETLDSMAGRLTANTFATLRLTEQEVAVRLPKFTIEASLDLGSILSKCGMPLTFDPLQSDFSGITSEGPIGIDSAIHKTRITVSEKGTVATAATGTAFVIGGGKIRSIPKEFNADHPFLFLIRENTAGTILFIGSVMDPSA
ncbi:MAG: hypothetical protein JXR25_16155 [Pontiellaceae bacterium]|nr:hypothetical protein [Pontiellaceae bacterium]MBN2786354.1 hypothetical protein [Pontiellaceae bacterium]